MINDIVLPYTFTPDTEAKATEVNANFAATKNKMQELVNIMNTQPDGNAVEWVSGGSYSRGVAVWGPDSKTYRAKVDVVASATAPKDDPTNWELQSYTKDADTIDGFHASQTPTAGKAVVLNPSGVADLSAGSGLKVANASTGDSNVLNWIEHGTCTLTATGMTGTVTGIASFARKGKGVILSIPIISGTSNAISFTLTGLATSARPSVTRNVFVAAKDNGGSTVFILASVGTDGIITLYINGSATGWTAAGTKVVGPTSVAFDL